jgi:predicted RNA-binding protein YlqC (UPF0109 family)
MTRRRPKKRPDPGGTLLFRLCEFLVHSLVEHPDQVKIDRIETERVDIFFLHIGKEDRGRILGKSGRTIGALRTFLEGVAARIDREVVVEILD